MNKVIKYQLSDFKKVIFFYYLIYIFIMLFFSASIKITSNGYSTSSGTEFSAAIVCFVLGLVFFKEHYWMFAQNGISRKTFYKGTLFSIAIFSTIISIIDQLIVIIFQLLLNTNNYKYQSIIETFYPTFSNNILIISFINILYSILVFIMAFLAGLLISSAFYRANKIGRILIAAGLPLLIFFILPMLLGIAGPVFIKISRFLFIIVGGASGNPLYAVLTFSVVIIILSTISYPLVKKIQV